MKIGVLVAVGLSLALMTVTTGSSHQTFGVVFVPVYFGEPDRPLGEKGQFVLTFRELKQRHRGKNTLKPQKATRPEDLKGYAVDQTRRNQIRNLGVVSLAIIGLAFAWKSFLGAFVGGDRAGQMTSKVFGDSYAKLNAGGTAVQLPPNSIDPSGVSPGAVWYNSADGSMRWYDAASGFVRSAKPVLPSVVLNPVTASSSNGLPNGGAAFGGDSVGSGYSLATPAGVKTKTLGYNECVDWVKQNFGAGDVEVGGPITAAGQFIAQRSGVTVHGNEWPIKSTLTAAQCNCPFLTDVDTVVTSSDLYGMNLNGDFLSRADQVLVNYGSSSGSPYSYTNNTNYYVILSIVSDNGATVVITINGISYGKSYANIALPPGYTVGVTWATSPQITLLGGVLVAGASQSNNYDVSLGGASDYGVTIIGWVNGVTAVDLGNHAVCNWFTINAQGFSTRPVRMMGAGGSNSDSCVNSLFGIIWASGFGKGSTLAFGMTFATHTDSNHIGTIYTTPDSSALGGSAAICYNDAAFNAAATDVRVNDNTIDKGLFQVTSVETNAATILSVFANASGINSAFGNKITIFSASGLQNAFVSLNNAAIFTGECTTLLSGQIQAWKAGQNNSLGVMAPFTSTGSSASTTSTSLVAAGFSAAANGSANWQVTPTYNGWLYCFVMGQLDTSTAGAKVSVNLYHNSSASTGGSAWAGASAIGTQKVLQSAGAGLNTMFSLMGRFQGARNTLVYLDLQYDTASAADQANLSNVDILVIELPM